jgi:uroporphyrinogen III methyltransferase/synthase
MVGGNNISELLRGVAIASIGPITSETIRKLGLTVTIEAKESTMPGLVRALEDHFGGQTPGE